MTATKDLIRQFDFSAGELVEHAKRSDADKIVRAGCRQMRNWRILNTGKAENRQGRTALFAEAGRTEEVAVDSETMFRLCFGNGTLRIRDSSGAISAARSGLPWTTDTVDQIAWTLVTQAYGRADVVICFPDMRPMIARWDGSAWSFRKFTFSLDGRGVEQVPFYRVAALGATITPSATSGTVTLTASESVFVPGHVGAIFRFANRRVRVTGYTSTTQVTADVLDNNLFKAWAVLVPDANGFLVGQIVTGSTSEAEGEISSINYTTGSIVIQLTKMATFVAGEFLIGPNARENVNSAGAQSGPAAAVSWDEQLMSDARGWPQSCSTDNGRLIFTDFPGTPNAVAWSSTVDAYNFKVGAEAIDAMVEILAGGPRIYHVIGGADEFVFTNRGVYYIPISESNPLRPGSVTFRRITRDAASQVRPAELGENVVFLNQGRNRLVAVQPTGQNTQPYVAREASPLHSHLIVSPIGLAATTADDVPEKYLFVVNSDGSAAVGRFDVGKDWAGIVPWSGEGDIKWMSALGSNVLVTAEYSASTLVELLNTETYVDGDVPINSIPSALAPGTDSEILEFYGTGTIFGNASAASIAQAYDDTTSRTSATCATTTGSDGYVGKTLDIAAPIKKVEVWPSTNNGFASGESGNITIELYGKNGAAPASATDGTLLGTLSLADTGSGPQTINSSDTSTAYLHRWVRVRNASATSIYIAQIRHYTTGLERETSGGGTGDLWFYAGMTVDVMDGLRYLGERDVDADGNLTTIEGEDLSGEAISVGHGWTATLEPFVPHATGGQSVGQTLRNRNVRGAVAVQNSTGFKIADKIVPPYRKGDDEAAAPELREEVQPFSVQGSDHDPRFTLIKDFPGPVRVLELSMEVDV